jgi:hypothetical protein
VRLGERQTSQLGCLGMLAAVAVTGVGNEVELLGLVLLGFVAHGFAMGLNRPSFASAAAGALDPDTTGVGMAVMRMLSQLGSAAGISIAVAARGAGGFGASYVALGVVAVAAVVATQGIVAHVPEPEGVALAGTLPALDA